MVDECAHPFRSSPFPQPIHGVSQFTQQESMGLVSERHDRLDGLYQGAQRSFVDRDIQLSHQRFQKTKEVQTVSVRKVLCLTLLFGRRPLFLYNDRNYGIL